MHDVCSISFICIFQRLCHRFLINLNFHVCKDFFNLNQQLVKFLFLVFISCVNYTFTLKDWITLKLYLINIIQVKEQQQCTGTIIWSILLFYSIFQWQSNSILDTGESVYNFLIFTFYLTSLLENNKPKKSPKIISRVIYFISFISGVKCVKLILINIFQQLVVVILHE